MGREHLKQRHFHVSGQGFPYQSSTLMRFVLTYLGGSQLLSKGDQASFPWAGTWVWCFQLCSRVVRDLSGKQNSHTWDAEAKKVAPCSLDTSHPTPHKPLGFCVKRVILQIKLVLVCSALAWQPGRMDGTALLQLSAGDACRLLPAGAPAGAGRWRRNLKQCGGPGWAPTSVCPVKGLSSAQGEAGQTPTQKSSAWAS